MKKRRLLSILLCFHLCNPVDITRVVAETTEFLTTDEMLESSSNEMSEISENTLADESLGEIIVSSVEEESTKVSEKENIVHSTKKELPGNPDASYLLPFSDYFGSPNSNNPNNTSFSSDGKTLTLSSQASVTGSIWSNKKIRIDESFNLSSYMYFGNKLASSDTVADGVFFGLQTHSPSYLGESGGGLGMYPGKNTSVNWNNTTPYGMGWEFDTYNNGDSWDEYTGGTANHVGMMSDIWGQEEAYSKHTNIKLLDYGVLANGTWKKFDLDWNVDSNDSVTISWTLNQVNGKGSYKQLVSEKYTTKLSTLLSKQFNNQTSAWWGFTSSIGAVSQDSYNAVSFSGLPTPTFNVKDELYKNVGDTWNDYEGFISATDGYGKTISPDDIDIASTVNMDKAGIYKVHYSYGEYSGQTTVYVADNPIVRAKKNTILTVGDSWNKSDTFEEAITKYGQVLNYEQFIDEGGSIEGTVDTNEPGDYQVTYQFDGVSDTADVVVKGLLDATPVEQTVILGTTDFDYTDFVTNVRLENKEYSKDEYTVTALNEPETNRVGKKDVNVQVTLKSDPNKTTKVPVIVNVGWGNSLVYKGWDIQEDDSKVLTMTLHTSEQPMITSTIGRGVDNREIHDKYPDEKFYEFNWFDMSNFSKNESKLISDTEKGNVSLEANGDDSIKEKIDEWGTNRQQTVNYGDVVRAWSIENKVWHYEHEEIEESSNQGIGYGYFEITQDGYSELNLNKLGTKNQSVPYGTSEEYLKEHIADFIEFKDYNNIEAVSFGGTLPDTTVTGDHDAVVLVEETLKSGKKIQYEYDVVITVEEPTLSLVVPNSVDFGETTIGSQTKLYWETSKEVSIVNPGNKTWLLSAKLINATEGFEKYLKAGQQSFGNEAITILEGDQEKFSVTSMLDKEDFIYVDYSSAKKTQEDTGVLEWTLTPSTREVEE